MRAFPLVVLALLAGCQAEPVPDNTAQRIALRDDGNRQATAIPSPDTTAARWSVAEDGQAIDFGVPGNDALLSLACDLGEEPTTLTIIRHAQAYPGQSALFPFIGNGMRQRFMADAVLEGGEWRWEANLPVDDPQLDIFAGTRSFTATLPGRGMLEVSGSRIPGEFLEWCRSGGASPQAEDEAVDAESPEPARDPA